MGMENEVTANQYMANKEKQAAAIAEGLKLIMQRSGLNYPLSSEKIYLFEVRFIFDKDGNISLYAPVVVETNGVDWRNKPECEGMYI